MQIHGSPRTHIILRNTSAGYRREVQLLCGSPNSSVRKAAEGTTLCQKCAELATAISGAIGGSDQAQQQVAEIVASGILDKANRIRGAVDEMIDALGGEPS